MKKLPTRHHRLSACAAIALLAGCGGAQSPIGPFGTTAQGAATAVERRSPEVPQAIRPTTSTTGSYLFAADCCGVFNSGDVNVYDPGLTGLSRQVVRGAFNPIAIAVDRTGTLYVLNQSYGYAGGISITEFDRGSTKRSRRIAGLYWGVAMTLDRRNNLYVANCNTCVDDSRRGGPDKARDSVTVYQAKTTGLLRTITQGIHTPQSLALDAAGNLYVANAGSNQFRPTVTVYGPGSTSLLRTVSQGIAQPDHLAIDDIGDVFVANGYFEVIEYASQLSKRLRTINDQIASPESLATDASGNLFVANSDSYPAEGWVSVYAPGSSNVAYKIVTGVDDPVALTLDGDKNLYVANDQWGQPGTSGRLSVYAPQARKPLRSMRGGRYGGPFAVVLGRK
jgi:sugar lactone lactonase YvrE